MNTKAQSSVLTPEHYTVMQTAAAEALVTDVDGVYVDGTFGRGGHARAILERLSSQGRLIALDRDPQAAEAAAQLVDARFHFYRTPFSELTQILAQAQLPKVQGVLLDLGVSSPQIDQAVRGFSFRSDGPLDMRMDPTSGVSAAQWLANVTVDELTRVIRDYGEERFARSIAKAIVARRDGQPITTTAALAQVVASAIPAGGRARKDAAQHPATRTFQAIRIHVNQELEELSSVLPQVLSVLAESGRMVVISFHSLEDRIVKRFIEAHAHPARALDARLPLRAQELPAARLIGLGKQRADTAELTLNPRARSAVMRVAQRTQAPLHSTQGQHSA